MIKLKPVYKDYIWGREKLRTKYGKDTYITPLAESWDLSYHPDRLSTIDITTSSEIIGRGFRSV